MSETFSQEGKINSYKKIIEDDLRSSQTVLESLDKTKRKWSYFKERFLNLRDESDKHIVRGFISEMRDQFAKKTVNVLIIKTLLKMLS